MLWLSVFFSRKFEFLACIHTDYLSDRTATSCSFLLKWYFKDFPSLFGHHMLDVCNLVPLWWFNSRRGY